MDGANNLKLAEATLGQWLGHKGTIIFWCVGKMSTISVSCCVHQKDVAGCQGRGGGKASLKLKQF